MNIIKGLSTLCTMMIFNDTFINFFSSSHPINTIDEAKEIGTQIIKKKYPFIDLNNEYKIFVNEYNEYWSIICARHTNGHMWKGGFPVINIRKINGKIISSSSGFLEK